MHDHPNVWHLYIVEHWVGTIGTASAATAGWVFDMLRLKTSFELHPFRRFQVDLFPKKEDHCKVELQCAFLELFWAQLEAVRPFVNMEPSDFTHNVYVNPVVAP